MRKIILTFLFAGTVIGAMSQTTKEVKGAVIDKNGNPLPGAKIEATGGAESTVTDADGTFSLEVSKWLKSVTATYPGMAMKKISLKNDNELLITLHEGNRSWFVNAVYQRDFLYKNNAVGLMFGQTAKWGWYAKVLFDTDYEYNYYSSSYYYSYKYYDDSPAEFPSISIGVVKRITKPSYLYFGLGYTQCYENYYYKPDHESGLLVDLGYIYNYKHFNLNLGASYRRIADVFFEDGNSNDGFGIHFGVGFSF